MQYIKFLEKEEQLSFGECVYVQLHAWISLQKEWFLTIELVNGNITLKIIEKLSN